MHAGKVAERQCRCWRRRSRPRWRVGCCRASVRAPGLIGSRTALAPVVISLARLSLHRIILHRASIAGLGVHAKLLVYKGQLLVELASCLREFVELSPPLGVGVAVARSRFQFGTARCRGHTDIALPCGVAASRGPRPPSRHRPRGSTGRAETVDVGRHRVVQEAGLSRGYIAVYCSMNSPAQRFVSAGLEGEVGEVVGDEPKTLLHWVWPQHADGDVVQEALDESLASRSPREDIGTRRLGEGAPGDRLHRSGVDEAKGAEA
jgi:hypothetical protein